MQRRSYLDFHHQLLISLAITAAAGILLRPLLRFVHLLIICWNTFAMSTLALAWWHIVTADPARARREARLQDAGRTFIFVFVVLCACASLCAIGLLLVEAKQRMPAAPAPHVALLIVSILSAWALVHTVCSMRYAHIYYGDADQEKGADKGVKFPGGGEPDYLDFAYYAFVVGMTCQVSDVQVTSKRLRRLTLLHGVIAFAFNTAILAMGVNVVAGLF
jgi:uncharacterized membrane protein